MDHFLAAQDSGDPSQRQPQEMEVVMEDGVNQLHTHLHLHCKMSDQDSPIFNDEELTKALLSLVPAVEERPFHRSSSMVSQPALKRDAQRLTME